MDTQKIAYHFQKVQEALLLIDLESVREIASYLLGVKKENGTVWLIGNGGSAATCSHFANDLRKSALIPAISLPDQTPTITAYGNDDGWGNMYAYPLHLFMKPNDCLVAISCSGRSENVCQAAMRWGNERLIVFTGEPGKNNVLAGIHSKAIVYANSPDIKVQEDVHLAVCHAIIGALSNA